ncbi:hypothetical protein GGF40_003075 [Coemansia sp. RSA 1286]|nr:hypothetical protein GGF40_003075 [Coemansia sp. RSA 1286]
MTVGRKDATIVIEGDHSVSRKHAVLIGGASDSDAISIKDFGSKFGVHINELKVAHGATGTARVGDTIHFGAQGTIFTVRSCNVSLCLTKMRLDSAQQTASDAKNIGFEVVDSVSECTHVVMPAVSATRTLLRALVLGRCISGPDFVSNAAALEPVFRKTGATAEDIDGYVKSLGFLPALEAPPMAENSPVCLDADTLRPSTSRRNLYASKMFLFADNAQHNHFCDLLADAGGKSCILVDADQVRELSSKFDLVCLVLPRDSNSEATESAAAKDKVQQIARTLRTRPISESEISLSVIAASVADHTNPAMKETEQAETAASSEIGTNARSRRRAAPRISNFWSAMVASSAGVSEPTQNTEIASGTETLPETQSIELPGASQLVQSSGNDQKGDHASVDESPPQADDEPDVAAIADAETEVAELGTQVVSRVSVIPVPLIKEKRPCQLAGTARAGSLDHELLSTVPNFKRFKKTVNIY